MPICADKLKELFPDYDQKKIDRLMAEISRMSEADQDLLDSANKAKQKIEDRAVAIRLNAAKYKAYASMNLQKLLDFNKFKNQDLFKNDFVRAIKAYNGGGENALSIGGNDGISDRAFSAMNNILRGAHAQFKAQGLLERVQSGELDLGIRVALSQMDKPEGIALNDPRISADALQAAKIFRAANDQKRMLMTNAGYPAGFHEGYMGPQSHDPINIKDNKEKWMDLFDKAYGNEHFYGAEATEGQKAKSREDLWNKITQRIWTKEQVPAGATDKFQSISEKGLGSKTIGSRELKPNSPEAIHAYDTEFAKGNLYESLYHSTEQYAKNAAALSKWGTNPMDAMVNSIDREMRFYQSEAGIKKAGSAEAAAKIVNDIAGNKKEIINQYKISAGVSEGPGELLESKLTSGAKNIQAMSKLVATIFKKVTELPMAAQQIKATTGQDFLTSTVQMAKDFFGLGKIGSNKELQALDQLKIRFIEDRNASQMTDRDGGGYSTQSNLSKGADLAYKYFGINAHTNRGRLAVAGTLARIMETHSGSSFEQLPARVSANLGRYNIGKPEWDVLKDSVGTFEHDGSKAILPGEISKLSDEKAFAIMSENNIQKKSTAAFKQDVENKYINFLSDHSERAVLHSTDRVKSFMRAENPNKLPGMLWEASQQFKSVAYMMHENMAKAILSNPAGTATSLTEGLLHPSRTGKNGGDVVNNLLPGVLFGTGLYAASKFAKDELLYQTGARDIDPWEELKNHPIKSTFDALAGGGGMGLIPELLNSGSLEHGLKSLAGPTLSTAYDATAAVVNGAVGVSKDIFGNKVGASAETKKAVKGTADLIGSNIPGVLGPFTKPLFMGLIGDKMKEAVDPNYLEKQESKKIARERKDAH